MMAERVKQLIKDPEFRRRLSAVDTDKYDSRKVAQRLAAEIEEIAGREQRWQFSD